MNGYKRWIEMGLLNLLLLAQAGLAQHKIASSEKPKTKVGATPATAPRPNDTQEGIHVHGRWTIVIRNPDGSVSSRQEFENSLVASGHKFLVSLLAGQAGQFGWVVRIGSLCGQTKATQCDLAEPAVSQIASAVAFFGEGLVPALSVSVPNTGANSGKFVLTGSATAAYAGQITEVDTSAVTQSGTQMVLFGFTGTALSQAIAVQVGQIMDVTVVVSFS